MLATGRKPSQEHDTRDSCFPLEPSPRLTHPVPYLFRYYEVEPAPIDAGAAFLIRMQEANGDWPQQHISGVFNRNCMITYANYRNIFPIWALAKYRNAVQKASK